MVSVQTAGWSLKSRVKNSEITWNSINQKWQHQLHDLKENNVNIWNMSSTCLVCPPFVSVTACTQAGTTGLYKTCWLMLSQHDVIVLKPASCEVTDCLAFTVFKCPYKCSDESRSGDCYIRCCGVHASLSACCHAGGNLKYQDILKVMYFFSII